ncbi:MAG: ATP-binding protein [Marinilabiliales bacterium]|nr:MAG: ATP-binding protein [Marinilabiliales bacterium]
MVYKNFRINVFARIFLLLITMMLITWLTVDSDLVITAVILGVIACFQVFELIRYIDKTNRSIASFLENIRNSDYTSGYSQTALGGSFNELHATFNKVLQELKKYRAEKQEHYQYLQTVMQHVNIGIIALKENGDVDTCNQSARLLLGRNLIRNIQDLEEVKSDLPEIISQLNPGERQLIKLYNGAELLQISLSATSIRLSGDVIKIVSLQNIHAELEEKEVEAWQKMIRVLTHEIMNSMTPISSLSSTIAEVLKTNDSDIIHIEDKNDIEELHLAIETINRRSDGLLNFVKNYRRLTRIPKPDFRHFKINTLFESSIATASALPSAAGIEIKSGVFPDDLNITADINLMEQVLLNMLKNSAEALHETPNPKIYLKAFRSLNNRICIEIDDNGHGVPEDLLDKIFMPFYTTKKEGSGIGLSLSRQIMFLHKGTITVKNKADGGAVFTLVF